MASLNDDTILCRVRQSIVVGINPVRVLFLAPARDNTTATIYGANEMSEHKLSVRIEHFMLLSSEILVSAANKDDTLCIYLTKYLGRE